VATRESSRPPLPARLPQGAIIAARCDIDGDALCTPQCRAAIKPFTTECLTSILTNSFFPRFDDTRPDATVVAAFVKACAAGTSAASVS
jgi:hypothetical protein